MPASSPKQSPNRRRISAPENAAGQLRGGKTPPSGDAARELLNHGGITAKQWGDGLKVGERRVQKWRSGEEPIPEERRLEILLLLPDLLTEQQVAVLRMIRRAIREVFGGNDPDRF